MKEVALHAGDLSLPPTVNAKLVEIPVNLWLVHPGDVITDVTWTSVLHSHAKIVRKEKWIFKTVEFRVL